MDSKRFPLYALIIVLFSSFLSTEVIATPVIQHWQTDNGARVLFVPSTALPMVDVRIVFDAGSARDQDISGLAALTNGLLAEGAGGLDAQQLAESFESVGAQLENDSLRDMALVGVRSLTEPAYLDKAISTLATVLTQPEFNQKQFARELARMKKSVEARKQSPSAIATEAFYRAIYGKHPYAEPSGGTEESLDKLKLDDIRAFYKQYYVARNAVVIVVGDLTRSRAESVVNQLIKGLAEGEKVTALPAVPDLEKAQEIRIDYPSKQSHIYVGQPGMKRGDADYFPLYVANHTLGGSGFASRLMESIREQRGLAYSVYSYFSPMREAGPFMMGMQTKYEQTDQALELLRSELDRYVKAGPTQAEVDASISNITGSFPLNLDSNSKLLGYLAMIGFYEMPSDYLQTLIDNMKAVDVTKINEALKRRLKPGKMVTVIVGNGQSQ